MGLSADESSVQRQLRLIAGAAAAAGALSLLLAVLHSGNGPSQHPVWLAVGFLVVFVLAELAPLHLTHEGHSESLRLEEALLVPMVLLLTPSQTLVTVALAVACAGAVRRLGWLKGVFNTGMVTGSAGVALLAGAAVGADGTTSVRSLTGAVVAGLVFCLLTALFVAIVIGVAQRESVRSVLFDGARLRVATWCGSLSLGVLISTAAVGKPWTLAVAVIPAIVLQFAYAGALRQWRERRRTEALYDAACRLHGAVTGTAVRRELVSAARELLAAGSARVVDDADGAMPPGTLPPGSLRAPLGEGSALEVAGRATGGPWDSDERKRLHALAAVASTALDSALLYEQMQAITKSLGEGVLALDETGVITFANPAAENLLGWAPGRLSGQDVCTSVDPSGRASTAGDGGAWVHLPRLRAGDTIRLEEHVVTRADGTVLPVALTASPVLREGRVVGAVVAFRDVTERKAMERRLLHQAFHDPLTGLPNRALFLDRLEHARFRGRDAGTTQAVLFVDLDRFKLINDSLGHRAGDDVLCTVASRMVGVLRQGDTIARFGGDEFTVLLEELASPAEATAAAERIINALRLPIIAGDREVVLSASIGIAVAEPGNAPGDLLAAADIAMYEAKSAGKDRWSIATADADDRALARLDLEMELRRALTDGELELYYQPVVRSTGGELYGLEALVRWRHPTLGVLAPGAFMELAEDTGLVLPLGDWVLNRACRDAKAWQDRHPGSRTLFAVNLSARQFQQPDLRDRVRKVLERTGLDPSLLVLEITETVVMQDSETVLSTLHALRSLRVRLAVDDFGTGFSSLSYLKRFPVDTIKIDKSFIDGLGSGPVDREIVAAVVRLASAVGMDTVGEGVETTAQLDQLRLLGCSAVQGFLISSPQPLADIERLLAERTTVVPAPRPHYERLHALS